MSDKEVGTSHITQVLIVDDVPEARRVLRRLMEQSNFRIIEAENGQHAVDLYAQYHPDLILMDISMPIMDGIEACARIRDMSNSQLTSIIMVTAYDDPEAVVRAFEAGATDYIVKPIHEDILHYRIQLWLRARRAEQDLVRRNRMLQQIDQVTRAATSSLDLIEVLGGIIRASAQALDVSHAYFCDANLEAGTITALVEYLGNKEGTTAHTHSSVFSLENTFPKTMQWLHKPTTHLIININDESLTDAEREHYAEHGMETMLLVPVYLNGDKLYGYLEFMETRYQRVFTPDEISLAQEIALRIGNNIQNARLYAALQKSEGELRHYANQLEIRNKELDAYGYTIAHDLKSPLHMILNYTDFVVDFDSDKLTEESIGFLDKVREHGTRMADMIDQLLVLAKISDTEDVLGRVAMEKVIDHALERFESQVVAAHVEIEIRAPLPDVIGNTTWLQEVVANLVGNALKYIDHLKDEHFIHIYATQDETTATYYIQDNGLGIPPDFIPKLFDMFTRVDKNVSGGLGLGLSIVKRLMTKMNGEVGVESEYGKASTFWIRLPLADAPRDKN